MNEHGPWTEEDFESLSWHDCEVFGISFDNFNSEYGSADLILDIDLIIDSQAGDNGFNFIAKRAELRFHDIFGLKLDLDYKTPTAGMCAFSIHEIERKSLKYDTGHTSYQWHIPINWPKGHIEFEAKKFTQTITGEPHILGRTDNEIKE